MRVVRLAGGAELANGPLDTPYFCVSGDHVLLCASDFMVDLTRGEWQRLMHEATLALKEV